MHPNKNDMSMEELSQSYSLRYQKALCEEQEAKLRKAVAEADHAEYMARISQRELSRNLKLKGYD